MKSAGEGSGSDPAGQATPNKTTIRSCERREQQRIAAEDRCAPSILERISREVEPYLRRTAAYVARGLPASVPDMVQEARITLWQLDLGRIAQRDASYVERILCTRMIQVYRSECRGGLTSGWSQGAEHAQGARRRKLDIQRKLREAA